MEDRMFTKCYTEMNRRHISLVLQQPLQAEGSMVVVEIDNITPPTLKRLRSWARAHGSKDFLFPFPLWTRLKLNDFFLMYIAMFSIRAHRGQLDGLVTFSNHYRELVAEATPGLSPDVLSRKRLARLKQVEIKEL